MRKKGKILSIVLSVMMLMQIFASTSFASQAPTNVHWAKDGDPNKFSDAELVFNLVDGIEVYKITLYKDNQEIYTLTGGYSSDTGIFYEWFENVLNTFGPGSYTATVGTVSKEVYEQAEDDNVPAIATSEMSDVLVWTSSVKKEEVKTETPKVETATPSTTTPTQTTTPPTQQNTDLRPFPQVIYITDMYNNDLFEIMGEYTEQEDINRILSVSSFSESSHFEVMAGNNVLDGGLLDPSTRSKLETQYYDGLTVIDIRDMKFTADGYDKSLYYKKIMWEDTSKKCVEFCTNAKKYEYGYLSTESSAYDPVNNILYVYEFNKNHDYRVAFIRNNGELFIFTKDCTKGYKAKIKKPLVVSVCYTTGRLLDPNVEHEYYGKIAFDQVPVIENGRTLVPLRAIFERIGADVQWDGATQTVTATKGDTSISLTINNTIAYKNGQAITLDVPAKILNGRTLVPVRFVADCFGVDVQWVQETQTVLLTAK